MGISALALLRLREPSALDVSSLQVTPLDDAVLLHTHASFANEPEDLSETVFELVGPGYRAAHDDLRGIFFVPDVAMPKARTYDGVIEEIGEGGVWGPLPGESGQPGELASSAALGALLGGILQQMPQSVLDSVGDAARGKPGAFEDAASQMHAAMGGNAGLQQLSSMLQNSGVDLQKLVGQVESALASDPTRTADLVERLFEGANADDDGEAEEEGDEGDEPVRR